MSDDTREQQSGNLETDAAGEPPPEPRGRRSSFTKAAIVAAVGFALVVFVRLTNRFDDDVRNVATLIVGGGTTVLLLAWFVFLSGFARSVRFSVAVVLVVVAGSAAALFRFEGFTGDMIPRIASRWEPRPDERLTAPVEIPPGEEGPRLIDLSLTTATDYPQFLGPGRNAQAAATRLATDWKAQPPREIWRIKIGAGWSAFAVVGSYAVTQEQRGEEELVVCYDLADGRAVWSHADPVRFSSVLGGDGPRATPTIDDGKVYTQGATGILNCLDGSTGEVIWSHNIITENGARNIEWGRSGSPLVTGGKVIVSAGGPEGKSLVAYYQQTGELVWSAGSDRSSYSSPALATLGGVEQVLIVNESNIAGHRLADGELLWQHDWPGSSSSNASSSQPVAAGADRVLLTKGYSVGSEMIRVTENSDGRWSTTTEWKEPTLMKTKMTNVAIRGKYAYGLSAGILECIDIEQGKRMWKRGRFGHGQVLLAGDVLLVTSEAGEVLLIEASPEKYHELARIKALDVKTWNNPALAGPYLLVRNHEEAVCYELPLRIER